LQSFLRAAASATPRFTDVAASKLTIRKRPTRDFGAIACSSVFALSARVTRILYFRVYHGHRASSSFV